MEEKDDRLDRFIWNAGEIVMLSRRKEESFPEEENDLDLSEEKQQQEREQTQSTRKKYREEQS